MNNSINREWIAFEFRELKNHLEDWEREIYDEEQFDEEFLRVQIQHAYQHLNLAWNARFEPDPFKNVTSLWERASKFPTDLDNDESDKD